MKILILDDDPAVLYACRRILEAEGIDVLRADSVVRACEMIEAQAFDLVLTDIKMPGPDGFEMIRQAKEKGLPVLMMTGYLTPETIDQGRVLGADHFIAKPFTPDELVRAVRQTIVRRGEK